MKLRETASVLLRAQHKQLKPKQIAIIHLGYIENLV
jgi:hypothetical protein